MTKKPTYQELLQRVVELESRTGAHNSANEELLNLQAIFDNTSTGYHIYHLEDIDDDKTLKMIGANKAAAASTGVSVKDMVGKTLDENFPGLREKGIPQMYAEVARTGNPRMLDTVHYGDHRVIEGAFAVRAFPLPNNCIAVTFENISDRLTAERALRRSEEKYRLLFETMSEGVCLHDVIYDTSGKAIDYQITDVNPSFESITGLKKERVLGKCASEVYGTGTPPYLDIYANVAQTREATTFEIYWPPMKKFLSISAFSPDQGKFATVFTDLTARKQTEEALRESEKRFMDLAQMLPEAVFETTVDMNLSFANQRAYSMFGYCEQDLAKGLNGFDMLIPADRERARENAAKRIGGENLGLNEYHALRKDGSIFPVLLHMAPILVKGVAVGFRGVIVDITEHKKTQERIQRVQKMESIGNLAGGIAHDFNNLLFPIIGMSELLMEEFPPDSPEHENAREILNAGLRGSELVRQILAFSRQSGPKIIPVRIQKILQEVINLGRSTIPADIEIFQDIQPDCGLVMADPTQVHQIAMNLITNAYHALEPAGGKISVALRETAVKDDNSDRGSLQPGRYALLSVSDTGGGIDPDIIEKIFEPYFTTKEPGRGTGLGLAVAYGIAKDLQGDIRVKSKTGRGTTFQVYFPLMERSPDVVPIETIEDYKTGDERILLVDDEGPIVKLETQMLERLGYRVTSRASSLDALEAFRANPNAFDLVITDMTMPNMTGDQLARELFAIKPDIPIIICTGFSERISSQKAATMGIKGFLMKPVVRSELARMVRSVLDEAKTV